MKRNHQIRLSIPAPCTEDWNKMTPTEQGRHCSLCNKKVIDFSNYTDKELAEFFKKSSGTVCGRITNYQANRSILNTEPVNRSLFHRLLYGTALASWLGITSTVNAQSDTINKLPNYTKPFTKAGSSYTETKTNNYADSSTLVGGTLLTKKTNEPLPFANIVITLDNIQVSAGYTDIDGKFKIAISSEYMGKKLTLKCTYLGYKDNTSYFVAKKNMTIKEIKLEEEQLHFVGLLIVKRKPFNTTYKGTDERDDNPYLSPRPNH